MTPLTDQRSQFVDIVKGILMMTVICGHTEITLCVGENAPHVRDWFSMGGWNMPAFMAIAGWFFWYSVQKRSFWGLIRNKCACIMLPAVFWEIVHRFIGIAQNHFVVHSINWVPGIWFFWSILLCILFSALCYHIGKKISFRVELLVALFLVVGLNLTPFAVYNIAYMFPFFYGGYLAHRMGWMRFVSPRICLGLMGVTVVLALLNCYSGVSVDVSVWVSGTYLFGPLGWEEHLLWDVYRLFLGTVGTIGFIGFLHIIYQRYQQWSAPSWVRRFVAFVAEMGCYSLALYAVQGVVVEALARWAMHWYVFHCNPVKVFHACPLLFARVVLPIAMLFFCWLCMVVIRVIRRYPHLARICAGKG